MNINKFQKHNVEGKKEKLKNIKYHCFEFLKYRIWWYKFLAYVNGIKVQKTAYKWFTPTYSVREDEEKENSGLLQLYFILRQM